MLIKTYNFTGKHAMYMANLVGDNLSSDNAEQANVERTAFFKRNIDVMFAAAVLGFKLNRKGQIEPSNEKKRTILNEQIIREQSTIQFLYRMIVILDDSIDMSLEDKLKAAFATNTTSVASSENENYDDEHEKIFYQYILGGIEYLYENLIGNGNNPIDNIGQLLDDFQYKEEEKNYNNVPII